MTFHSINPYSKQSIGSFRAWHEKELSNTLQQVAASVKHWKETSVRDRLHHLSTIKFKLLHEKQNLARLITTEMGKPIAEAMAEIEKCAWLCDYYIEQCEEWLKPQQENLSDKTVWHSLQPIGAVLGIMPWNYPFWQVFRYAIPNLLAGNIVLLKHAPNTMACAEALQNLFSGNNPSSFFHLPIDVTQVEQVVAHPVVQGVCLTGSVNAGRAVAALAGKYVKKSVMELGSADAFVILPDAQFEMALSAAFTSRMLNAGQTCIAAKRIFIEADKIDDAIAFFKEKIKAIRLGNTLEEQTQMGPISKLEFVNKLRNQVEKATQQGARLVEGAQAKDNFFLPGILLADAEHSMHTEELFGPVLTLIPYQKEEGLLDLINNNPFGLTASVWSSNVEKAFSFSEKIEAGTVVINDFMKSDPRIPFGGIKLSGYGREMGKQGFISFLNEKVIIVPR